MATHRTNRSALPSGAPQSSHERPMGGLRASSRAQSVVKDWLTTVDHKKIGIMYGAAAMFFLVIGGVAAHPDPAAAGLAWQHPAVR